MKQSDRFLENYDAKINFCKPMKRPDPVLTVSNCIIVSKKIFLGTASKMNQ